MTESRSIERHVVARADASASIGTGHVLRCRTLLQSLVARGWRATIATRDLPDALEGGLVAAGIEVVRLRDDVRIETEPAEIARTVGTPALFVADHYDLDAPWFQALRARAPCAALMAIDDLADRPLPVDLVLNQNLGASEADYEPLVPTSARILAGPTYALVRPEFAERRGRRQRDGRVERILIFISGSDPTDVTSRAVTALGGPDGPRRPLDVVVGAAYPHLAALARLVDRQPATRLHVNTDAMADLMDRADLAVGAPSSASWERCTLGLPAVVVTVADNQVAAARHLVEAGAIVALGRENDVTAADIRHAVADLCDDPTRVAAMSRAAAAVTDGQGTGRVVAEIEAVVMRKSAAEAR